MEQRWHLGRWSGIPVSMHWTVLLTLPWMVLMLNDVAAALIGFVAFCGLQIAHEFGHVAAARWRRVWVGEVMLAGLHGVTTHGGSSRGNEIFMAWSGVLAQLFILLLALLTQPLLPAVGNHWVWFIAGPLYWVLIKWNLFLIVAALLPIGPFDGHVAWQLVPWLRQKLRRRQLQEKVVKLDAAKRRELQERSEKMAADIIKDLSKNKKLH